MVPKAIDDPTERSIPPEMMIRVAPIAAVATTVDCSRMRRWLGQPTKLPPTTTAKSPQTKISPMSGPSRVSRAFDVAARLAAAAVCRFCFFMSPVPRPWLRA